VLCAVDVVEVMQESGESMLIGLDVGRGIGGKDLDRLAALVDHPGVMGRIGLDPLGHVVHLAVLPGAEPEQVETHVMIAGLVDEQVDGGEIELPRLGLHLLPVDGSLDRVGVHAFDDRPHLGQGGGPRAGVIDLAAENEEGGAIDDERVAAVVGDHMRSFLGIDRENEGGERKKNREALHRETFPERRDNTARKWTVRSITEGRKPHAGIPGGIPAWIGSCMVRARSNT
jgi:hypothetical protein